eukprot:gene10994-12806_t
MSRIFVSSGAWRPVHDTVAIGKEIAIKIYNIALKVGDQIRVEEETDQWYRGVVLDNNSSGSNGAASATGAAHPTRGIFPANYVLIKNTQDFDVVTNEMTQVIREWGQLLISYYRERRVAEYKIMKDRLSLLLDWHSKILSTSITLEVRDMLKGKVISKIEEGRRLMGLDMIVRTANGEPAHETNTGIIQLYRMKDLSGHLPGATRESNGSGGASGGGAPLSPVMMMKKAPARNAAVRRSMMVMRSQTGDISPSAAAAAAAAAAASNISSNSYQPHHIFLDLKIFMCSVGEQTELFFSIYNKTEGRFITEEYQVGLTAQGMPHDIEKIGKLSTLFIDISKKELQTDLYLVCRLIRKGKMLTESNKKAGPLLYRRPFGCAVLRIEDNIAVGKEMEHTIPIYTSTTEATFPILHEMIIKNPANLQQVPKAKGVCIGLTLLPGELKRLMDENPVLDEVSLTNKLGFPEVIYPGDTRNDLFITLESGEYSQDRKTSAKNVEVIVQARLESGELVRDCLFYGDKPRAEFKSVVFYHSNQPHWAETLRINVPLNIMDQVYLVVAIRHCTTSETKERTAFAMTYLKLTNADGTVIANKTHALPSYKTTKTMEEFIPSLRDPAAMKALTVRKGEVTKLRILLCSTMCTQNLSLLTLLKWDEYAGDLGEVLNRLTFVDQIEIIKFMQETFNALFAILEAKRVDPDAVFNVITWIIGLLVDEKTSRYTNFRPVLDIYIASHFASTVAHNALIGSLKRSLLATASFKTLMSTLKSMEYTLKFVVMSKRNHDRAHPSVGYQTFLADLTSVFDALSGLMQRTEREYIGAQTIALKTFSAMFSDLGELFSLEERADIARRFIDSVRFDESLRLLNMEKMHVIHKLVEGDLFLQPSSRALLLDTVKRHLKQHMGAASNNYDDIKKQAEIIAVMIDTIQCKLREPARIAEVVDMLPEIVRTIKSCSQHDIAKLDMVHNLYAILYLMEAAHFDRYIASIPSTCWTVIYELLYVLNRLLAAPQTTYPENWLTLTMFQYATVKKVIIQTSTYLLAKLNNNDSWLQIDLDLWSIFFTIANTYFKLKGLALENFSEAKQKIIKTRYGDMRNDLIVTIQKMWQSLEKHQIKLLPTVIAPFLELMLINQTNLKQLGIDLYYQLLKCEYKEHRCFKKVETETINTLDQITYSEAADILDEKFRVYFSTNLEQKMRNDPLISEPGRVFIKDMTMFLELLYALRTLPDRPEYEDDRTIAAMQLMAYLKQTDRQDTYIKYVHLLCNQHLSYLNYTEAGNTILLHADLYEWNETPLEELSFATAQDALFRAQSSRERKEKLYKQAIEYLDKGKAWERAITLMKQLTIQYEEVTFEYTRLADILQQESTFYRKVIGVERFFAEYFRVGYYGRGFDASIQGKEFIYKGVELERMSDFVQRIQAKFPSATVLTYTEMPPPETLNSPGQHLQIYAVRPAPSEPDARRSGKPVPPAVQKYRQHNNINTFIYSKPFKRKDKAAPAAAGPGNEFRDLWITNHYYVIQDTFPTIHRRSEIVKRYEVELSPIENAVNTVIGKNVELVEMSGKHENGNEANISPFTMVLKGVIDAAVNGGVNMYKQVFFSADYLRENSDKRESVEKLKLALTNQVQILKRCLMIHAKHIMEFENIVHKATNSKQTAPKRKHVRSIVLETYSENSGKSFYGELHKRPLDTNDVVCYKCIVTIHNVVQEGPRNVLGDTINKLSWFEGLRSHWARYPDSKGYGNLIAQYCTFMIDKVRFHQANPTLEGGLSLDNYQKNHKVEDIDINRGMQMVCHLMDLLDAVFRFQNSIVDAAPYNDCKTSAFIPLVLESYAIYLFVVQLLTCLVDKVDTMEVIEFAIQRFYTQYQTLRNFYINANAINSVSSVIAVPNLPPDPPKFIRKRREQPKPRPAPQALSPPPVRREPPPMPEITQIPVPVPTPVFIRQTVPVVYANPFMQQQDNTMWGNQYGANGPQPMYNQPPPPQQMQLPPPPVVVETPSPSSSGGGGNWVTFNNEADSERQRASSTPLDKREASLEKGGNSPTASTASVEKTRVITKIVTKTVSNTAELNALRARVEELERLLAEEQEKNKALTLRLSEREAMIQEATSARKRIAEISEANDSYTSEVVKQNDELRAQFMALRDYYEKQRSARMEADFSAAQKAINGFISLIDNPNNLGNQEATHSLVIEDLAHHMAKAQSLLGVCSQEGDVPEMDIFGAVGQVSDSLKNLFHDAKGASRLITDQGLQSKFLDAARRIGALTQNLFESVRLQGGQCQDEEDRRRMTSNVNSLQQGTATLEELAKQAMSSHAERVLEENGGFDLDDIAERELMAAAKTIEDAAKTLLAAKQRRPVKKDTDAPDVSEAILEAAMAITSATSTLVGAATIAQRERVEKGRASGPNGPLYRNDPTWAEGLISAAKNVAAATKALVDVANKAASGQDIPGGVEEALIATSKAVTAATSQLVAACKSKSDINSPSQHKLSNAAKSVQHATNLLVAAAKAVAASVAADDEIDFDSLSVTGYKVKEMEQQMAIIRLEKQLEVARKGLSVMRKTQYSDSASPAQ